MTASANKLFTNVFICDINMTSLYFQQGSALKVTCASSHRARDPILNCYDAPLQIL